MSLRTPTSPKNVSVFTKLGKAARSRIAQLGLAAGLSVIAYSANAEAQERPPFCVAPDGGAPVPCPGGTELVPGPRVRTRSAPRPRPDSCGDSGAHSPVANVDAYLRDPVIAGRIARVHPGLDVSHGAVYTITVPVSVSRLTWDAARAEPRTDSRTLAANTRVYGVRVNDAGAYDANGRQIRLVFDTNCGDVINGTVSVDNASVPVAAASEPSRDAGETDTSPDEPRREEPSRVRDDVEVRRTSGDDPSEGRAADAYAPAPEPESRIFGGFSLGVGGAYGLMGTQRTESSSSPDLYSISGSCRPENPSNPTTREICTTTATGASREFTITGGDGVEVSPATGGNTANRTLVVNAPNQWRTVMINGERQDIMVDSTGRLITREGTGSSVSRTTYGPAATIYAPILIGTLGIQWINGVRVASHTGLGLGFTEGNPFLSHLSERLSLSYSPINEIWDLGIRTGLQIDNVSASTTPIVSVPVEASLSIFSTPISRDTARLIVTMWGGIFVPVSGSRGNGAWDIVPQGGGSIGFQR